MNFLKKETLLGFDTESRPSFKKGKSYPTSLIQLAGSELVVLIRLNLTPFCGALAGLLADPGIIKAGVAIRDDIRALQKLHEFTPGTVFNIQKYSVHDGPGIRTIVFLKGCPLSCKWCSNPESQASHPQVAYNKGRCIGCHRCIKACEHDAITVNEDGTLSLDRSKCDVCKTLDCAHACPAQGMIIYGENKTVDQILKEVEKDALFYARSGGGMTLSGGEPLMHADIALPLLREARHRRIKTAIETCGCIPWDTLKEAAPYLNYVLFDVKQMDSEKHREGAGVGNELILSNLKKLLTEFPNLHVQVRTPIIPGFNDNDEFAYALGEFLKGHENVGYEALPYHRLGTQKYDFLSREYAMGDVSLPDGVAQRIQRIVDETRGAVTEEKK